MNNTKEQERGREDIQPSHAKKGVKKFTQVENRANRNSKKYEYYSDIKN